MTGFDQVDKKTSTFNATKFRHLSAIVLQERTCLVEIKTSLQITIIICICQFKNIIHSCLPKWLTFWCIIREECIVVWVHLLCRNNCVCNFCSCCLAGSQFLNLVPAISLQMPDKICSLYIYISRDDLCQEKLIVITIAATRQTRESIPHFIVPKDTHLNPSDNVAVIVCQHHFQCEIDKKYTLNKTYEIKILLCAIDWCPPFPPLRERCWQIHHLCRSLVNCMQSCKHEIQWPLVHCNHWCLVRTVEWPSSNIVHNRQGIPSN